jgi:hypothetical protein
MYIHLSWPFWVVILGYSLCVAVLVLRAIARGASAAGLAPDRGRRLLWWSSSLLLVWAAIVISAAAAGVLRYDPSYPFPFIGLAVVSPLIVAAALYRLSAPLRSALGAAPLPDLIGIQAFRAIGFVFLILLLQQRLPAIFALPAGIGDVLIGLTAILVARSFHKNSPAAPVFGLVWNFAGILDLVVAIGVGFLASTTPLRLIFSTPPTDLVAMLPLVMITLFLVPLFLMLHAVTIERITSAVGSVKFGLRVHQASDERQADLA